jgi:hypothetical protein
MLLPCKYEDIFVLDRLIDVEDALDKLRKLRSEFAKVIAETDVIEDETSYIVKDLINVEGMLSALEGKFSKIMPNMEKLDYSVSLEEEFDFDGDGETDEHEEEVDELDEAVEFYKVYKANMPKFKEEFDKMDEVAWADGVLFTTGENYTANYVGESV